MENPVAPTESEPSVIFWRYARRMDDEGLTDYVGARPYPPLLSGVHTFYVPRRVYDEDIRIGLRTAAEAYAQFAIDFPRCNFYIDGRLVRTFPNQLCAEQMKYCTQCIMAMPIEMIHNAGHIPFECGRPMCVHVTGRHKISARKELCDGRGQRLRIRVVVDFRCEVVVVEIRHTEQKTSTRIKTNVVRGRQSPQRRAHPRCTE